jgi:hypothetical protein
MEKSDVQIQVEITPIVKSTYNTSQLSTHQKTFKSLLNKRVWGFSRVFKTSFSSISNTNSKKTYKLFQWSNCGQESPIAKSKQIKDYN